MEVIYTHCAGLDAHKKTVVAHCMTPGPQGAKVDESRTFGTMTADLLTMSDWLLSKGVTHVVIESTGEFWKPIYNILEGQFEVLVVNAKHVKNVTGRKTDVKDAEWLCDLLRHGLLRASFIPPQPQRDLRDLTRQRTNLVQDRVTVVNRLQKVLEWANIKLSAVATDVTGVSARAMLEALVAGQVDPEVLAQLARGRMRQKRALLEQALAGRVRDHHRFLIANHLTQIDFLDEQIATFDDEIAQRIGQDQTPLDPDGPAAPSETVNSSPTQSLPPLSWDEAVILLDTIPGIGRRLAEQILAEIGSDMSRFTSEAHLASWAKLCPGNNESAGKRHSGRTGKGNRWLRSGLVQAAQAAVRTKDSYYKSFYQRLAGRRGAKRAIVAVAHHILIAIYHMLSRHEPFRELGANHLDERNRTRVVGRLARRIERLGFQVTLAPAAPAAP